ncbi:4Fe-4S ferredoxin [Candidatus Atribacteria bacterium RBG_19FT_COMBO_35_14]|uniref:4Fe-4S ferredoxin n=1 Tax=Candidatus Sediminicultor quintus TaxID=1797291 RepID=A0A1F5A5I3_9BACT|nr:MAG: 4Fe-4S ferredoxin [Candidatus Atribacteria bacterium RBG_19FT_COMBO_35_14]
MVNSAKVYFTDLRAKPGKNLLDKLKKLVLEAGIKEIGFKDKFTALKIHFGEPGNLSYIRPNYAACIVKLIKDFGGRPFLTDANTLYYGKRANAVDHLNTAMVNGFNRIGVGCDVIIADGLKGTEYREISIDQKHFQAPKIAAAIADADIIISLTHFKGHEMTGFGGALKNLGMGSGSRAGKMEMHSNSKPKINLKNCIGCGQCIKSCSQEAIHFNENKKAEIDYHKCIGCGQCVAVCQYSAAVKGTDESEGNVQEKIAEYTYAVLKNKPHFHISFIMNVSPYCDCWGYNDMAIVPDIGMAASFDPVALDRACVDLVNKAPMVKGSVLEEKHFHSGEDKFTHVHIDTDWKIGLNYAEKIGLGTQNYDLIIAK